MNLTDSLNIIRFKDGKTETVSDLMINEAPLAIVINGEIVKELLCSPAELYELAVGFLKTQGIIFGISDIESIDLRIEQDSFVADVKLRDVEIGNKPEHSKTISFNREIILQNLKQFYEESTLQKATAGVHRCALCDDGGIIVSCDDISRHCAFDKVLGHAVKESLDLSDKYVITSGRVPLDMIKKVDTCGLPMLVSRTAPTASAVLFAREKDITLLGFSREDRFNIYSGFLRII